MCNVCKLALVGKFVEFSRPFATDEPSPVIGMISDKKSSRPTRVTKPVHQKEEFPFRVFLEMVPVPVCNMLVTKWLVDIVICRSRDKLTDSANLLPATDHNIITMQTPNIWTDVEIVGS